MSQNYYNKLTGIMDIDRKIISQLDIESLNPPI